MKSHQSRINARRITQDQLVDTLPLIIATCMAVIAALAMAVVIGAALAAIPEISAFVDQAEQLHGF
ncbi:hypothetical protein [Tabrizicola sp. M-4]|uniref:hypothetical protein n=1 Tax=Tabrizicola sp. M-4 TaxID=3055847 RepID=UPI003DA81867